jgi:hypothetical protein
VTSVAITKDITRRGFVVDVSHRQSADGTALVRSDVPKSYLDLMRLQKERANAWGYVREMSVNAVPLIRVNGDKMTNLFVANLIDRDICNPQCADFLADCLNYLSGGSRMMMISTWKTLLDTGAPHRQIPAAFKRGLEKKYPWAFGGPEVSSPEAIVARWLNREDGMSDMMATLDLIYGS